MSSKMFILDSNLWSDMIFLLRYGIYPLTAFAAKEPPPTRPRAISPETAESIKSVTPEPIDIETRKVVNMMCNVKPRDDGCDLLVSTFDEDKLIAIKIGLTQN